MFDSSSTHNHLALSRFTVVALLVIPLVGLLFRLQVVLGTEVEGPMRADAGQFFAYAYNPCHHGTYSAEGSGINLRR